MTGGGYYLLDGTEVSVLEWAAEYETRDRSIGKTTVGDVLVSTVWLGGGRAFGEGPPLIFETMVFRDPDGEFEALDEFSRRYWTREQAVAGHAAVCVEVQGVRPRGLEER